LNGHLASGERVPVIKIWNVSVGLTINTLKGHTRQISALVNIKSDILASGSLDGTVRIWNHQNGTCLKTLTGHLNTILGLVWLHHNGILLSGSLDRTLKFWHVTRIVSNNQIENPKYGKCPTNCSFNEYFCILNFELKNQSKQSK
jgi:WD40 repeat protein